MLAVAVVDPIMLELVRVVMAVVVLVQLPQVQRQLVLLTPVVVVAVVEALLAMVVPEW